MNTLDSKYIDTKKSHDQLNEKLKGNDRLVVLTFYITYVFLMTTATITFIESISTTDQKVRHILKRHDEGNTTHKKNCQKKSVLTKI